MLSHPQHDHPLSTSPIELAPHGGNEGVVVVYRAGASERAEHDHATCNVIARKLAKLKRFAFVGEYDAHADYPRNRYFVPANTLVGVEHARSLGIADDDDLFGGVVPHPFVATKCISHSLVDDHAIAPDGWSGEFPRRVRDCVLHGFAAFSIDDALRATLRLFAYGPVRIKRALGIGGCGQTVVHDRQEAEAALAEADTEEVSRYGIALEQDLTQVTTYSVGQARVDRLLASYCGTQRLTENRDGKLVYGGSELLVARGDYDALLGLDHAAAVRIAIEQARRYDDAAFQCFTSLFASRRNYDVACGLDAGGCMRSGVLEQSWRVGGASSAEVEALAAFAADSRCDVVRASSTELYAMDVTPPPHAIIYFQGIDDRVGPLTKYTVVEPHVHAG